MKYLTYAMLLAFLGAMVSCGSKPDRPESVLNETQKAYDGADLNNTAATTPPAATAEPAQNAAGVWHYTCPNGCAGGAGSAVPCGTCGTTLAHNAAYHQGGAGQPNIKTTTTSPGPGGVQPGNTITFDPSNPGASANAAINTGTTTINPTANKQPEPAQNAAGVWHYVCGNGCEGGAGAAGPCPKCGGTLAHNSDYHK